MLNPRERIIKLQKAWVKDLKNQIYNTTERNNPELDRYYKDYRAMFRKGYKRSVSRKELIRQLQKSDIIYFGDFHTLKVAQKTVIILLEDLIEAYERKLILGLEMLRTEHQTFAEDYLKDKLNDQEFLDAIDYPRTWGFEWSHYKLFFNLARKYNLKVIGLNSAATSQQALYERDQHAAEIISTTSMIFPQHLVATVFGDLHIAKNHIPKMVEAQLKSKNLKRKTLTLYQNSETLYWELVSKNQENSTDVLKLGKDSYCVMNATPLVKFQSWLNWQESGGELDFSGSTPLARELRGPADITGQFSAIVEALSNLLGIKEASLDNFEIYTFLDLDALPNLQRGVSRRSKTFTELSKALAARRSLLLIKSQTIYLGNLSINNAANMAGKFIYATCSRKETRTSRTPSSKESFYQDVFYEALGTFCTLIMNPRYRISTLADYARALRDFKGRRRLSEREKETRERAEYVLEHEKMIQDFIDQKKQRHLRKIYNLSSELHYCLTRSIGNILGAQMFHAFQSGDFAQAKVQDLFSQNWEKTSSYQAFVGLKKEFEKLPNMLRQLRLSL